MNILICQFNKWGLGTIWNTQIILNNFKLCCPTDLGNLSGQPLDDLLLAVGVVEVGSRHARLVRLLQFSQLVLQPRHLEIDCRAWRVNLKSGWIKNWNSVDTFRILCRVSNLLGWLWFGCSTMLLSQFCQIPICPSRIGQTEYHLKSFRNELFFVTSPCSWIVITTITTNKQADPVSPEMLRPHVL